MTGFTYLFIQPAGSLADLAAKLPAMVVATDGYRCEHLQGTRPFAAEKAFRMKNFVRAKHLPTTGARSVTGVLAQRRPAGILRTMVARIRISPP